MTSTAAPAGPPVRVDARLDAPLSRWLWLVKWLLALPHFLVLALLWVAFVVLSLVAFVAILVTGRYPRGIFEFNVGVLRWSWRVAYYTYGALGTDRYPPFTLDRVPDYPATLDIAYPERLSRGLALVKWWLLALPHYLIIAVFVGGGGYAVSQAEDVQVGWPQSSGLIGLLVLIAGIALLFTGRYPRGLFDLVLGMQRWVLRVAAYAALMTDAYPPFRLDLGGSDPASLPLAGPEPPEEPARGGSAPRWSAGRVVTVVLGSLLIVAGAGTAAGGIALLAADRDTTGFLGTGEMRWTSSGHAVVFDAVELRTDVDGFDFGEVVGDVRVTARVADPDGVFVGIGPAADVDRYLAGVQRDRVGRAPWPGTEPLTGGAPPSPPAEAGFWVAAAAGPGTQEVVWRAAAGRWSVVVMNADGSRPITADVSGAVTAPVLPAAGDGLLVGGGIALVVGALLVVLAVPRPRGAPERSGMPR